MKGQELFQKIFTQSRQAAKYAKGKWADMLS
jgi:hypothetical protein